jgi:hypothetical protein
MRGWNARACVYLTLCGFALVAFIPRTGLVLADKARKTDADSTSFDVAIDGSVSDSTVFDEAPADGAYSDVDSDHEHASDFEHEHELQHEQEQEIELEHGHGHANENEHEHEHEQEHDREHDDGGVHNHADTATRATPAVFLCRHCGESLFSAKHILAKSPVSPAPKSIVSSEPSLGPHGELYTFSNPVSDVQHTVALFSEATRCECFSVKFEALHSL